MHNTVDIAVDLARALVPQHLGALHGVEQVLVLVLAFGPFVLLGVVLAVRTRQARAHGPQDPQRDR
ncbi:MAG: hypothetical protein LH468_00500 [Nocardioides sp.]|nr:hypothetical protein [Nocardioides sp.]